MRYSYLLVVLLLVLTGCRSQVKETAPVSNLSGKLDIEVPQQITAGEAIVITVHSASKPDDGTPITFLTMNGISQHLYQAKFASQMASFLLPEEDTRQAGLMTVIARSGQAYGETTLTIQPAEPVSPLFMLAGPRTIVTNNEQQNMAVVVANDRYGNAISIGNVVLRVLFADGMLTKVSLALNHLVAWSWLRGTTTSGKIQLSAAMDEASAPQNTLDAVASAPTSFAISANPPTAEADGHQLISLRSDVIRDEHGNVMPDGTQVIFVVETPLGGLRRIPTYTIAGVADTVIQAPQAAGTTKVWAIAKGIKSDLLTIMFTEQSGVGDFQLQAEMYAAKGAIILTAGPVTGTLGQLMPDGTQVQFNLTNSVGERQWLTSQTQNGYAQVEIRMQALRLGIYSAEVSVGSKHETLAFTVP